MTKQVLPVLACCLAAATAGAMQPASQPAIAPGDQASSQPERILTLEHLRVDLDNRRILLDAQVCLRNGPLEFLLCEAQTKEHESILSTRARASDLHAAMLALGLALGTPARWSGVNESAVFLPPEGARVKILLRWADRDGTTHEVPATDWLTVTESRRASLPAAWIFVGSDLLPNGEYWANLDGGIVSVSNFASAVLDVPFKSSSSNALLDFATNAEAIPALRTKVDVIFEPLPGADKAEHARTVIEIDRFGRYFVEGEQIPASDLTKWAVAYLSRHALGMVVLRASAGALVYDVERAREELQVGGVREFDDQRMLPTGPVLPRTPDQAKEELAVWEDRFANASDFLRDPAEQAEETLREIDRQTLELKARQALWMEYAKHLRQMLEAYRASTQPAETGVARPPAK